MKFKCAGLRGALKIAERKTRSLHRVKGKARLVVVLRNGKLTLKEASPDG